VRQQIGDGHRQHGGFLGGVDRSGELAGDGWEILADRLSNLLLVHTEPGLAEALDHNRRTGLGLARLVFDGAFRAPGFGLRIGSASVNWAENAYQPNPSDRQTPPPRISSDKEFPEAGQGFLDGCRNVPHSSTGGFRQERFHVAVATRSFLAFVVSCAMVAGTPRAATS
jgi:hypothetical protein